MKPDEALTVLYRAASKSAHPDSGGDTATMAKVNEARSVLLGQPVPKTRTVACAKAHCPDSVAWDMVINFGKHKGTRWADVPLSYLAWLVESSFNPTSRAMALRWLHVRVSQ